MRDDIVTLLHTLYNLLSTKQMLLKKFEVNLQTIQLNLINGNEEAIVTIISVNNAIIEDISLCNYSIASCITEITSKIGIEYTQFEDMILKINNPACTLISDLLREIHSSISRIYNLNQTLIILLTNHEESLIKNINEINKIIELQTHRAY
ncbi:MAG: hypothetical protein N3F66_05145 [Spirochaetes bacterium]|nr:hypothetical protein [Spirochaetota bacterium]